MVKQKIKVITFLLSTLITFLLLNIILVTIGFNIFVEEKHIEATREKVLAEDFDPNQITNTTVEVEWPWYAKGLYVVSISIFWFFLGRIACRIFLNKTWYLYLLIPLILGIILVDFFLPIYLLSCYAGGKLKR